ncbi:MAG: 4Fe-4S dicluster domain-containing protein [Spirochaetota bacterium]
METKFLESNRMAEFILELVKVSKVYTPERWENDFHWKKYSGDSAQELTVNSFRTVEPLKSFFFQPRKTVATYFSQGGAVAAEGERQIILGAKACDLKSLTILDSVFLSDDYKDPFYINMRDATTIIASDCSEFKETCFCNALGIKPFPEENYDLSFSSIPGGFLFSAGSKKGEVLFESYKSFFREATSNRIEERERRRKEFLKEYGEKISKDSIPDKNNHQGNVRRKYQSGMWEERSKKCVECGACNLVCPTCHCFILEDFAEKQGGFTRVRLWDSCQYMGFARVAGGANPRKRLAERIRNRFVKKFDFFQDKIGDSACTGCGRCIEACIAKIDIREVLKELATA